jgi:hypothetical protein
MFDRSREAGVTEILREMMTQVDGFSIDFWVIQYSMAVVVLNLYCSIAPYTDTYHESGIHTSIYNIGVL